MNTHLDSRKEISANYQYLSYFSKHLFMTIHQGGQTKHTFFFFCCILFIYTPNKRFKGLYYMPKTALGTRNREASKITKIYDPNEA